jgi:hypothetical protein
VLRTPHPGTLRTCPRFLPPRRRAPFHPKFYVITLDLPLCTLTSRGKASAGCAPRCLRHQSGYVIVRLAPCAAVTCRPDGSSSQPTVQRTAHASTRPTAARVAAVILSPPWGVSHVALPASVLRGGHGALSGVHDAADVRHPAWTCGYPFLAALLVLVPRPGPRVSDMSTTQKPRTTRASGKPT